MSEGLYALAIVLVLFASYRFVRNQSAANAAIVGATVGIAALVRAEAILLAVVLLVPLIVFFAARRRPMLVAIAFASCALVLAPWVIRNMVVFSRPVTISTGDATLAGSNCPQAYHGSTIGLWFLSCYDHPPPGDESVASAFWRRQGERYAAHHTSRLPLVVSARRADMGRVQSRPDDRRERRRRPRALDGLFRDDRASGCWLRSGSADSWCCIAGTFLCCRWSRNSCSSPFAAVLVWGAVRFRVPADVVLVMGAGIGIDWILRHGDVTPRSQEGWAASGCR